MVRGSTDATGGCHVVLSISEGRNENKGRKERTLSLDKNSIRISYQGMRPSKSTSNLSHKGEGADTDGVELSTEGSVPGVLKIFGGSVVQGANYKSVLATESTSANELVEQALERYGLQHDQISNYVICDVVGRVAKAELSSSTPELWTEDCVRMVAAYERPLTIQRFWKPQTGYARRFELRRRIDFPGTCDSQSVSPVSTPSDKNSQHSSPASPSSEGTSVLYRTDSDVTLPGEYDSSSLSNSEFDQSAYLSRYGGVLDLTTLSAVRCPSLLDASSPVSAQPNFIAEEANLSNYHVRLSHPCPYLLTLRCSDIARDAVAYVLTTHNVRLGSDPLALLATDICLYAPDIMKIHCYLRRQDYTGLSDNPRPYLLQPQPDAQVQINGKAVSEETELVSGDLLALGAHYLLFYKDPCATGNQGCNSTSSYVMAELQRGRPTAWTTSPSEASDPFQRRPTLFNSGPPPGICKPDEPVEVVEWRRKRNQEYETSVNHLRVSYSRDKEASLLDAIMGLEGVDLYPLTQGYLLLMTLEHCAVKYDQISTRQLVLNILHRISSKIKVISETLKEKNSAGSTSLALGLMADLHPLFIWLSNILEMQNYFRGNMNQFLLAPSCCAMPPSRSSLASAEDEIISGLEEAVIFVFQQIVYYITKVLYNCLPVVLDGNPFSANDDGIDSVLSLYQTSLQLARSSLLHPQIISQLFCYLFFFTSTSLFNLLMDEEAAKKYFKWSRGAQLRGNLDSIEAWAAGNNLRQEASAYLRKVNCLADLLATPKVQLMQADWRCLRPDFPALTPAQLHHVLAGYQLEAGLARPAAWLPTPEDVLLLERAGQLMETYNQHPPLVLPSSGYKLDLRCDVADTTFQETVSELMSEYGDLEDDDDSGLSVSHHPSSSQDQDVTLDSCSPVHSPDSPLGTSPSTHTHPGGWKPPLTPDGGSKEPEEYAIDVPLERTKHKTTKDNVTCAHETKVGCDINDSNVGASPDPPVPPSRRSRSRKKTDINSYDSQDTESQLISQQYAPAAMTAAPRRARSSSPRTHVENKYHGTVEHGIHYDIPNRSEHVYMNYTPNSVASEKCNKSPSSPDYAIPVYDDRLPLQVVKATYGRKKLNRYFSDNYRGSPTNFPPRVGRSCSIEESQPPEGSMSPVSKDVTIIPLVMQDSIDRDTTADAEDESDLMDKNVFEVELTKSDRGLGLGLIDGMYTPLRKPGIYVRTLVDGEAAASDGRLRLGDRILAVNGTSVVGADYQRAMNLIREGGDSVKFLVSPTSLSTAMQITSSSC